MQQSDLDMNLNVITWSDEFADTDSYNLRTLDTDKDEP